MTHPQPEHNQQGKVPDREAAARLGPREIARRIDHTLLKPEAGTDDVIRLCREAVSYGCCSVCIHPCHVPTAARELADSPVLVGTVAGFPLGAGMSEVKACEARLAIEAGAAEIDMVLNIGALRAGDRRYVLDDMRAVTRETRAAGVCCKVILETCLLSQSEKVLACALCVEAGADFVKTSTGFASGGATVADVALLSRQVASHGLGVKAAGGIRTFRDALAMIQAGATRLGVSATARILTEAGAARGGDG